MSQLKKNTHTVSAPAALSTLEIPDAVAIPWDDTSSDLYGVGIAAINGGLKVFVESYDTMAIGDAVDVHWDSQTSSVATAVVDINNQNERLGLTLPEAGFVSGDFQPFFRIRRVSGATADSPLRAIRVKLELPGGKNPDPSTSHNENLAAPQVGDDILQNGVDAVQAAQGVNVTIPPYLNMAEFDRIEFSWGGERLLHTVIQGEVDQAIVLTVNEDNILTAGDGHILLMYQIIDAAANRSDGWSLVTELEVQASGAALKEPYLNYWRDNIVPLTLLGDQNIEVMIQLDPTFFAVGDTVKVTWEGHTVSGVPVTWVGSQTILAISGTLSITVPNATIVSIAGSNATFYYTLQKSNGEELLSRRAQAQIIGEPMKLPAPTVSEAQAGSLAADVLQATVNIAPYTGMAVGDLVTLIWSGERNDGQPTDYRDEQVVSGNTLGQTLVFKVAGAAQVAPLDGGSVTVYYQVTRAQGLPEESEHIVLQVGQAAGTLPAPTVSEASGGRLEADVPYATVMIQPYTGMAADDKVELQWSADITGVYNDWLPVTAATVGHLLTFRVLKDYIADNHKVSVSYSVTSAAGATNTSAVLSLQIGDAQLLPAAEVDEADGNNIDLGDHSNGVTVRVPAAASLEAGDLVTVLWSGQTAAGTTQEEATVSGADAGQTLPVHIDAAVVDANSDSSIEISYTVVRAATGLTDESELATYQINAAAEDISSLKPFVPEATGNNGALLTQSDYYRLGSLQVIVPIYRQMAIGDTVKIYWIGRDFTYPTDIVTVTKKEAIIFTIPRLEFIDTIGDTATIYFTVQRLGVEPTYESAKFDLQIEGQTLDLKAPDVSDDLTEVVVIYAGMSTNDRIEVRVSGDETHETELKSGNDTNRVEFDIPQSWLAPDGNGWLLFNYAVGISGSEYQFSRVTRKRVTS